jgi:hypothetical protein
MIRALACALLCTVGTIAPATAFDLLYPNLKGVTLATYEGVAKPDKGRCAIDMNAWNTAIDFVANQSTKLQLLPRRAIWQYSDARKFATAPWLYFSILTMDTTTGCAGTVGAKATVMLESSTKILATGNIAYLANMTIWEDQQLLSGPHATFSSFAIQTSEQIMKSFVNAWARSQGE